MARFILVDNCSGYVFADSADVNGKIWIGDRAEDFARDFDASIGVTGREYESAYRLGGNETGYRVYRADIDGSEAVPVVWDGQDIDTIAAVERDCVLIDTLRVREAA